MKFPFIFSVIAIALSTSTVAIPLPAENSPNPRIISHPSLIALSSGVLSADTTSNNRHIFKTGAQLDKSSYLKQKRIPFLSRGDNSHLPSSVSLYRYAPEVGNQGEMGSCVGWASAYAAHTLAEKRRGLLSSPQFAINTAFSPSFIFNQIKLSPNDCEGGSYIEDALQLMVQQGSLPMDQFPYSDTACQRTPTTDEQDKAYAYAIDDFRRLGGWRSSTVHIATREAIAKGNPVVFGMMVGKTFMRHRGEGAITFTERDRTLLDQEIQSNVTSFGGHAMTVIGYDDRKFGGAFLIMNSWGKSWGDNGFAWLTYDDYRFFTTSAFELIAPEPHVPQHNLGGDIRFIALNETDYPLKHVRQHRFRITQPMQSGTRFRTEFNSIGGSFVYVFGTDQRKEKVVELFPGKLNASEFIRADDTLLFPGPTEDYYSQLDHNTGSDLYVIVMSAKRLEPDMIKTQLQGSSLPVEQALKSMFAGHLVKEGAIQTSHSGIRARTNQQQTLTYAIVEIEHVDTAPTQTDQSPPKIVITSPEQDPFATNNIRERQVGSGIVTITGKAQDQSAIQRVSVKNALEVKYSSRGPFRIQLDTNKLTFPYTLNIQAEDIHGNLQHATFVLTQNQDT